MSTLEDVDGNLKQRLAVLDHVQEAVFVTSPDGAVVYMNPRAASLLEVEGVDGPALENLSLQKHVLKRLDPRFSAENRAQDVELPPSPFNRVLQAETFAALQVHVPPADADGRSEAWMIGSASLPGEPPLQIITVRDQTDTWQAERRFHAVFETDPAPSVVARLADARVLLANTGMAELTGFDDSELKGMTLDDMEIFSNGFLPEALTALRDGARIRKARTRLKHADGTDLDLLLSARTLEFDDRECGVFTFVDITELERARLARQAEQVELIQLRTQLAGKREQERLRLAQDLHDGVLQSLLAASTEFALDQRRLEERGDKKTADMLRFHRDELLSIASELRKMIRGYRPVALRQLGLWSSLEGAMPRSENARAPRISLPKSEEPGLPDKTLLVLYRVSLEAIRNALKHADALEIDVSFEQLSDEVVLTVSDDGEGFEVPERLTMFVRENHFGLAGIQDDVGAVGGDLKVSSTPGEGTQVVCRLPIGTDAGELEDR